MPSNDKAPNFALMAEFDATQWSGEDLFTHGSTQITMPTFSQGSGFYDDALIFLNGRASESGLSLGQQIQDASDFGASWSIGLTADDKIFIENTVDFTIEPTNTNQDFLGFGSSTSAVLNGSK